MGYCFMTTQKIKTLGALGSKFKHNYRKINVENADPSLFYLNDSLITSLDENNESIDYVDTWKKRFDELPYYENRKLRSNAVLAIEVVTTFSREENIDIESWKRENVEWLKKTFNIAGDGKDNVIDVIYHADEPGNVHCHAIIIPVDEKGHLNASRFLDGQRTLSIMQSDYAKSMKHFGLERGLENGQAKHEDIKKYYADLNRSIQVPEPEKDETALEYRDRILNDLQTMQAAALRERREKQREMERKLAEKRKQQEEYLKSKYENLQKEKEKIVKEINEENSQTIQALKKANTAFTEIQGKINSLEEAYSQKHSDFLKLTEKLQNINEIQKKADFFDTLQHQLSVLQTKSPEKAQQFVKLMQQMNTLNLEHEQIK